MATTAKKTTAKKTAARKTTAKKTTTAKATTTAPAAEEKGFTLSLGNVELSKVDVKALATDYAYATVGAGDKAVEVVRELPQRIETVRKQRTEQAEGFVTTTRTKVESFVKEGPSRLQAELEQGIETARKEVASYATRGRKVVDSVTNAEPTKRALTQTENARSQVKAAVTSVRKAVEQGQDAVEHAAGRVGIKRSA